MQSGDSASAYSLFSTQAKATVTPAQFDAIVKQVGPILNAQEKVTNKKVDAKTGQAASSEITYEIKGTDGLSYSLVINLTKEGDLWKVLNFDSKKKS
jgi:cellobiose phosphorylase